MSAISEGFAASNRFDFAQGQLCQFWQSGQTCGGEFCAHGMVVGRFHSQNDGFRSVAKQFAIYQGIKQIRLMHRVTEAQTFSQAFTCESVYVSRLTISKHRVKYDQSLTGHDWFDQSVAQRSTVKDARSRWQAHMCLQVFYGPYSDALICEKDIAYPKNQCFYHDFIRMFWY